MNQSISIYKELMVVLCKSKWVNLQKKNEKSRKNVKNGNPKGFIRESLDGREALVYS
jgi:hypothetical protein